jgi:hypothetical protein
VLAGGIVDPGPGRGTGWRTADHGDVVVILSTGGHLYRRARPGWETSAGREKPMGNGGLRGRNRRETVARVGTVMDAIRRRLGSANRHYQGKMTNPRTRGRKWADPLSALQPQIGQWPPAYSGASANRSILTDLQSKMRWPVGDDLTIFC